MCKANARKTHCKRGHPLSGENVRVTATRGYRLCMTCNRLYGKRHREKNPGLNMPDYQALRLDKYATIPEAGCWIWLGQTNKAGYGACHLDGKRIAAHRFFYEHYVGKIPKGMFLCHKCDTPSCVNPDHLFPGTAADNTRDMFKKGRAKPFGRPQRIAAFLAARG